VEITRELPMIFQQFEDQGLSQYSYAVGCDGTGTLAVVDPMRTVEPYLEFARGRGARITHVLETHIHADFASGARELADRTGAELLLSAYDEGETYETAFEHRPMRDGDSITLGAVRIQALHTPGHTPEHLAFLVYDGARSETVPMLMLSGDFLFVGSLGRPDLLGEDQKVGLAERLYESSRKLGQLPDGLEIHPGHGAGSMCGSGMGGRPLSTLGFERITNLYLDPNLTQEKFVETILERVPPRPDYYLKMKQLNADGPPLLHGLPGLHPIEAAEFKAMLSDGHVVIDARRAADFSTEHIPGSLGIGVAGSMSQWAGWVVPYDRPILLVAPEPSMVSAASAALVRVGLDNVRGYLDGGIAAWREAGYPLTGWELTTTTELAGRLDGGESLTVLDVRTAAEWATGHIESAVHVAGGALPKEIERVPNGENPLAVICGSGYRSTVACSVLERAGFDRLINVVDGMAGWHAAGLPVSRD
jgi:hydroxyacylglutathione hydrolase